MANLKEIRTRITSVASTMQITSAMKMVSAAKLKRAQDAITQMRPYAEKLREIIVNISGTLEGSVDGGFSQEREVKTTVQITKASMSKAGMRESLLWYLEARTDEIGTEIKPETTKRPHSPNRFLNRTQRRRPGVKIGPFALFSPRQSFHFLKSHLPK